MPNRDGTGPLGKGSGTGRFRGFCLIDHKNNANNNSNPQERRRAGGKAFGSSGGGRSRGLNSPNNMQNK